MPVRHSDTGTVLDALIDGAVADMEARRSVVDEPTLRRLAEQTPPALDAEAALRGDGKTMGLIAEVKRASPSKGDLSQIADPAGLAETYAAAGASVISVLTEERRFRGSLSDLRAVRQRVSIPVLRKDFIVDPYQVYEARVRGADLVLLIVAGLDDSRLKDLHQQIEDLGMQALVEVHTEEELERALAVSPRLLGVNARNLKTLEVDLERAATLLAQVPVGPVAIGESAVLTVEDVRAYAAAGADAVLVGEALVTHADPAQAVRAFRAVPRQSRTAVQGSRGKDRNTA